MTPPQIRAISAAATIAIRHAVLRHGLPRVSAIFDGDEAAETHHFGAFEGERLVGVASVFDAPFPARPELSSAWQLRGMATVPEVRGQGFGRALLAAALTFATRNGATILWCNARVEAVTFYTKNGFTICGDKFDIPTAGPHLVMATEIPAKPHGYSVFS